MLRRPALSLIESYPSQHPLPGTGSGRDSEFGFCGVFILLVPSERRCHLLHVRRRAFSCKQALVDSGLERAGWAIGKVSYGWDAVGFIKNFVFV